MSRGSIPGLRSPYPLVDTLPALMQDDDVSVRWVSGLDDVIAPIYSTLDNLAAYVDPHTAPADWLEWLSQWVALPAGMELDDAHRRRAIAHAGDLFSRRGTAGGLRDLISTTLRCTVEVTDSGGARWSAAPGGDLPGSAEPFVQVRVISVEEGATVSPTSLRALVTDSVPAHVRLDLDLGPLTERSEETS